MFLTMLDHCVVVEHTIYQRDQAFSKIFRIDEKPPHASILQYSNSQAKI